MEVVPVHYKKYDYETLAKVVRSWREFSVKPLLEKPRRYLRLLERAQALMKGGGPSTIAGTPLQAPRTPTRMRAAVDPDSSPIRDFES